MRPKGGAQNAYGKGSVYPALRHGDHISIYFPDRLEKTQVKSKIGINGAGEIRAQADADAGVLGGGEGAGGLDGAGEERRR